MESFGLFAEDDSRVKYYYGSSCKGRQKEDGFGQIQIQLLKCIHTIAVDLK